MKAIILSTFFFLTIQFASGQADTVSSETIINADSLKIIGKYLGTESTLHDVCAYKLQLKDNHKYVMVKIYGLSGVKRKEKGTWKLEGDILALTDSNAYKELRKKFFKEGQPVKLGDTIMQPPPKIKIRKYKIVNGDLWCFSDSTMTPTILFVEKVK